MRVYTLFSSPVKGKHCLGFLQLKVLRSTLNTAWKEVFKKKCGVEAEDVTVVSFGPVFFCDRKAPTHLKKLSKLISVQ